MKKNSIIKNNPDADRLTKDKELLAEFMGLQPYQDSRYGKLWPNPVSDGVHEKTCFSLKYDTSFDWLMPVARKFKYLPLETDNYYDWEGEIEMSIISDYDVNLFFQTIVRAIKWYNEYAKNNTACKNRIP